MILCNDIKANYELYKDEYQNAVIESLNTGYYIGGEYLKKFELAFADYNNRKYCVGLNSGLDALVLAVRALGIGKGDEVIVPANTFIATVLAITNNGATPVFVEPDCDYNIDVKLIESKITSRTKAIMPVHLYGRMCKMDEIISIAKQYSLFVIEDCAQAHGASIGNKKAGSFGTIGCFSFYPTKPLGAMGDGGCIITDDETIANKVRMLRNYGSRVKYVNDECGINSRLDDIQAACLLVGLKHIEDGNAKRLRIAARYNYGITNSLVVKPNRSFDNECVYHQYPILCENRDALQLFLEKNGIQTIVHYPIPPHLSPCYDFLGYKENDFPITEKYANQELSLPIYSAMNDADIDYVIDCINSFRG